MTHSTSRVPTVKHACHEQIFRRPVPLGPSAPRYSVSSETVSEHRGSARTMA